MCNLLNLVRVLNVGKLIIGLLTQASFDNPRFGVDGTATTDRLRTS